MSGLEEVLKLIGQSDRMPNDHVIWLQRKFTDCEVDVNTDKMKEHFDFLNTSVDERATDLLQNLSNQLHDTVEAGNRISLEVPWQNGGINPETKEHAQYLDNLCEKYKSVVKETVDKLVENRNLEYEKQLVEAKNSGELRIVCEFYITRATLPKLLIYVDGIIYVVFPHL